MKIKSKQKVEKEVEFSEIKEWYEKNLAPDKINFNDQDVYENTYHAGRWCGIFQCLDESTQILIGKDEEGDDIEISISEVIPGDAVVCYDEDKKEFVTSKVINVHDNGEADCIVLDFQNNVRLICTLG